MCGYSGVAKVNAMHPEPNNFFKMIREYAAEIGGTVSFIALVVAGLWKELHSLFIWMTTP